MAKLLETVDKLEKEGFTVCTDHRVGGLEFDIFATKQNEKDLYIEVKTTRYSEKAQVAIKKMFEYVKSIGNSKFELIVANPPQKKEIYIEDFHNILGDYLNENMPESLRSLSYNTSIEYVSDIELTKINITELEIGIDGTGNIEVTMMTDSEDDEGYNDVFPCEFQLTLDRKFRMREVRKLKIDTSAFYE
ncbi:DUF3883 domain-containing protein [Paenibacillus sp. FSL F4-0125]|uniref:pPIWI-associating nuclease domain-containing protein n=1 Tax=Paenibacillus sp. FSL F4-0125 TaxID=2954730 RepID=UPI0030FA03AF